MRKYYSDSETVSVSKKKIAIILFVVALVLAGGITLGLRVYSLTSEYTINYYSDDVLYATKVVKGTDSDIFPVEPQKDGYAFGGWFYNKKSDDDKFTSLKKDGSYMNNVINVYAHWKIAEYTISYDLGGGVVSGDIVTSYNMNTESIVLPTPTRQGYTFIGWSAAGVDGVYETITLEKGSIGNKTYIAIWEKIIQSVTIIWGEDETFVFNGQAQAPSAHIVEDDGKVIDLEVFGGQKDVGNYSAYINVKQYPAYIMNGDVTKSYTIVAKEINVEWDDIFLTYNGQNQAPTAKYYDVDGKEVALTVGNPQKDVGLYAASVTSDDPNYIVSNPTEGYYINPMELMVTWTNTEIVYNGKAQAPTACYIDANSNPIDLVVTNAQTLVGNYQAHAEDTNDANYKLQGLDKNYSIIKREVTLSWENTELTYNGDYQLPTAEFIDVDGQTASPESITGAQVDASSEYYYANASDGSYTFTNAEKQFKINPYSVTVVWGNIECDYEGTEQVPSATYIDINGKYISIDVFGAQTDAGTYDATLDTSKHSNYSFTNGTQSFTINPCVAMLVWDTDELVYSGVGQAPKATFVDCFGEEQKVTVNGSQADVGNYTAVAKVSDFPNYSFEESSKSYSIVPYEATIIWSEYELTYDGSEQCPTATYVSVNGKYYSIDNISGGATDADTYTATADVSSLTNYYFEVTTKEYTISPFETSLDWGTDELVFSGVEQVPEVSFYDVYGEQQNVTASGNGVNVGTFSATAEVAEYTNYSFTNTTQEYTIKAYDVTIDWTNIELVFSGSEQSPTASYTDVFGENQNLTVTGAQTNVGNYTANADYSSLTNYAFTVTSQEYSITPYEATIIWGNTEITYDGTENCPTAMFVDAKGKYLSIDNVSGGQIEIGTYTATADVSELTNYHFEVTTVEFSIVEEE